ncbi:endoplasmic reticulum aminopeptidase 1-like [Otolemur garnettii]|uniref:endoplasmic reticulum aminopeptidase 1-like n=1 Tax=Otolemur garnettii TaxID=30611 RepID=UPI000C7F2929|nr:endoplasmic reticulum aminopeptidase 1-like [Otolemur garnettii]
MKRPSPPRPYALAAPASSGETARILASTQFELTTARMAFPCFDANFSIKIRREPQCLYLNMPLVKSVTSVRALLEDHFNVIVKMSTYLVAFIMSDFESVSKIAKNRVNGTC